MFKNINAPTTKKRIICKEIKHDNFWAKLYLNKMFLDKILDVFY